MKLVTGMLAGLVFLGACAHLPTSAEYVARGDGYFEDGNLPKAVAAYDKALELNPNNLEAYASRGSVHFFQGYYELAQADLEHVLKANPFYADAYTAYGSVLAARGAYEEALKVFEMAIALKPSKPENFFSRAGVFFMLGQYPRAVADYTTVLSTYPAAEVYNARGAVYLRMGKEDLAEKDFQMAKTEGLAASLSAYNKLK